MAKIAFTIRDYSDELSNSFVRVGDLATLDTWSNANTLGDDLATHIEAHTIGTLKSVTYGQETQALDDTRPASAFAQREMGFRVFLTDDVNFQKSYFTIPCADLAIGSVVAGQDELDLTAAPTAALVTWVEANVLSADGNAVTVDRIVIVGRSS
jgi:hypothetical protein